jgi:coenzyme F420-reducing hydrogenase delta subunit/Pyruvate/2-oxoacid:ferredoxin oxidoreductase delta subunit
LAVVEACFLRFDQFIGQYLPSQLNPVALSGALASAAFFIAVASGALLIIWYTPSLHGAFASVQAMGRNPWGPGLVRSLHLYSSDACLIFGCLHALRMFAGRRFANAHWLAWITGVALFGLLWLVGWLGFWLIWDERAYRIALGVAKIIDAIPIGDPLSLSLLTDDTAKPLLFLMVFFAHMLLPLALGGFLWLHLARLARPKLLPQRRVILSATALLVFVALVFPAHSAGPAHALASPKPFHMDFAYLFPLWFTDRMGGGALWGMLLAALVLSGAVPWYLTRGSAVAARVDPARCHGCGLCEADCPYGAIRLLPGSNGPEDGLKATVIFSRCTGCGICVGACNPAAIRLLDFTERIRERLFSPIPKTCPDELPVAFACAYSAAGSLSFDSSDMTCSSLPGYRVVAVPCAGWLHPSWVERLVRRGVPGVLVIGCGDACCYREGSLWTDLRFQGQREPVLRPGKIPPHRLKVVHLDRTQAAELRRAAAEFRQQISNPFALRVDAGPNPFRPRKSNFRTATAALILAALFAGIMVWENQFLYTPPPRSRPELVVSFKDRGAAENCRPPRPEEVQNLPLHMRPEQICSRERAPVRMRVSVDDRILLERTYAPRGIFSDGPSVAAERFLLSSGKYRVQVEIGESGNGGGWSHRGEWHMAFAADTRHIILFDRSAGFKDY